MAKPPLARNLPVQQIGKQHGRQAGQGRDEQGNARRRPDRRGGRDRRQPQGAQENPRRRPRCRRHRLAAPRSSIVSSATKLGSLIAEAVADAAQRVMSGKWPMATTTASSSRTRRARAARPQDRRAAQAGARKRKPRRKRKTATARASRRSGGASSAAKPAARKPAAKRRSSSSARKRTTKPSGAEQLSPANRRKGAGSRLGAGAFLVYQIRTRSSGGR